MPEKMEKAHSTVGAAEQAKMGANFGGQVPNFDCSTSHSERRGLFEGVGR